MQKQVRPRIAYIARHFPVLSQTFVQAEILDHLGAKIDVDVIALNGAEANAVVPQLPPALEGRVHNLAIPYKRFELLRYVLALFVRFPRTVPAMIKVIDSTVLKQPYQTLTAVALASELARMEISYDIFHCHFGDVGDLVSQAVTAANRKEKIVTTIHAFEVARNRNGTITQHLRHLFENQNLILTVNSIWRDQILCDGVDPRVVRIHHMGVDLSRLQSKFSRVRDVHPFEISMTGRMVEKKGHMYAIEAIADLKKRRPDIDICMHLVGSGPLQADIDARARALGISDIVRFHGARTHQQTLEIVDSSDVFILPSVTASDGDMEGIPVSLMEAMALEKPVISTRHSGIPELIENDVDGLLCAERDAHSLSRALERVYDDLALRDRLGRAGRKKVSDQFDAEKLGRELRALYSEML